MPQSEEIIFPELPGGRRRVTLTISAALYHRMAGLRRSIEARFKISLTDEDLVEYLCEKALERMEEWERLTRPPAERG